MNLIAGTIDAGGVMLGDTVIAIPDALARAAGGPGSPVTVGLRPEAVELVGEGHGIPAIVNLVEELGAEAYVYAQLAGARHEIDHRRQRHHRPHRTAQRAAQRRERSTCASSEDSILLFDSDTGTRITTQTAPTPQAATAA